MSRIDGFILAGGASSRMGRAKAGLSIDGRTFLERAADALAAVAGPRVQVVGGTGDVGTLNVIPDELPPGVGTGSRGSIIGLYTALLKCSAPWAAVLACDLPFVSGELIELLARRIDISVDATVPVQADGRLQPLCAIYDRGRCLPVVERVLNCGNWSLNAMLGDLRVHRVEFFDVARLHGSDGFFMNINTPEDLRQAELRLERPLG